MRNLTEHPITQQEVIEVLHICLMKEIDVDADSIESYILQKLFDWNKGTDQDSIDVVFNSED